MYAFYTSAFLQLIEDYWLILTDVFFLTSSQPSSLSAKLSELASRRANWLSSLTIGSQQEERKSCSSLETVIGSSETDRDGSMEQGSSLQRSASSSCLSSPVVELDVSVCVDLEIFRGLTFVLTLLMLVIKKKKYILTVDFPRLTINLKM